MPELSKHSNESSAKITLALHAQVLVLPLRVPSRSDALLQSLCSQPHARDLNVLAFEA